MKKTLFLMVSLILLPPLLPAADAPKKLLVVSTTAAFRHSSIPTGEKILEQLSKESGEFTVDYLRQPEIGRQPVAPRQPILRTNVTEADQEAFKAAQVKYQEAMAKWVESFRPALEKLSPDSLKNYDGVVFLSTSGNLPIPDREGFLNWIRSGKAFIGIHAASDTFHGWTGFREMLGAEFDHHDAQLAVEYLNVDPSHPATAHLPKVWPVVQEEVYQFKLYDPAKVHELLVLDKKPDRTHAPGHYAVAWCHDYGKGKAFYTAIGHREDIWDTDPNIKDRKNSVEFAKAFQAHLLGGIEWALGLKPGDATPQAK
jgi:uncharacterized protein